MRKASEKHQNIEKPEPNDTQQKILELLSKDPQLSAAKLAEQIGIASRNIESNIKKLKEQGILIRHGSPKSGYWEIAVFFPN
jgi:predicted HTH transcriptional regulator